MMRPRCALMAAAGASAASSTVRTNNTECRIPTTWTPCPLLRVVDYNHDTSIFIFGTTTGQALNLPVCGCILLKAEDREHGGGDAIRPYTPIAEAPSFERIGLPRAQGPGEFALLVKRYREWGYKPEGKFATQAFAASYRPPGAVSNFVHQRPTSVCFKHVPDNVKALYPFTGVDSINMIAVGAGIAPMIQALDRLLFTPGETTRIVLLYGNRNVEDILLRETLDAWAAQFPTRLKVVYSVGSRYANVHFGVKRKVKKEGFGTTHEHLQTPPIPPGFDSLPVSANQYKETGWVGIETIQRHAFPPNPRTRTFVCGLPEVYHSLCGPRSSMDLSPESALARLGYDASHVVKF